MQSIVRVRLSELELWRPRQWGACWLVVELWQELELDRFWGERLSPSRKGTRWDQVLLVLVAYRLIAPGSEWRLHREWFGQAPLWPICWERTSAWPSRISSMPVTIYCWSTNRRCSIIWWVAGATLFNASFEVLLYDLTSTYFESDPPQDENDKRRFGYSRDKRSETVCRW